MPVCTSITQTHFNLLSSVIQNSMISQHYLISTNIHTKLTGLNNIFHFLHVFFSFWWKTHPCEWYWPQVAYVIYSPHRWTHRGQGINIIRNNIGMLTLIGAETNTPTPTHQPYTWWIYMRKYKYVFQFHIIPSTLKCHSLLKFTLKEGKGISNPHILYHGWWWPGDISIRGHDTELVCPQSSRTCMIGG